MPLCTIHLLSISPTTTLRAFLTTLKSLSLQPLTVAQVIRWIILPTGLSSAHLLAQNIHWDLLLILPSNIPLPAKLQLLLSHRWSIQAGVPSKLLQDFPKKNESLLYPKKDTIPPLTGSLTQPKINRSSSQDLELSPELQSWIQSFSATPAGQRAVSMLNLLAFEPGKKSEYLKYGAEFARSIGSRRGGVAKIVGTVVPSTADPKYIANINGNGEHWDGSRDGWDEVALAHYPSIMHFADMLASEDYQTVNHRHRVPSLRDTCILCTSEVGLDDDDNGGLWKPRL